MFILPIFTFTQCLQFMDKSALNYANLFGYQKALGLHGSQCKLTHIPPSADYGRLLARRWLLRRVLNSTVPNGIPFGSIDSQPDES
jgi:hypothetical protein